MAALPVPATGCGNRTRGTAGMPSARATKSPCGQNFEVTKATAGKPLRATAIPSRTVPDVQLPQWPQTEITASQSSEMAVNCSSVIGSTLGF